jgi:hypothetical protein
MEAELATLARAGASTLVGLMVADSWSDAKQGFARFFTRRGSINVALRELEASRSRLMAAIGEDDARAATAIEADWRSRLIHVLLSDPAAARELGSLLHVREPNAAGFVCNISTGDVHGGSVIQAGQISGTVSRVSWIREESGGDHESGLGLARPDAWLGSQDFSWLPASACWNSGALGQNSVFSGSMPRMAL